MRSVKKKNKFNVALIIYISTFSGTSMAYNASSPPFDYIKKDDINLCTKIVSKKNKEKEILTPQYSSLTRALKYYNEGDVICIADSDHPVIVIDKFHSDNIPLTIRPLKYHGTTIKNENLTGTGITIKNSTGIIIKDFIISGGLNSILVQDSSNISILSNRVFNTGNQAVSIKPRYHGGENYRVEDNIIFNTGLLTPQFGEGLYIGDGSYTKDRSRLKIQHTVSDVLIKNNVIHNTKNEAIDVKANAYNVKIIGNTITDVDLKFNAAITIATESSYAPQGGYHIEDNVITNVTNRSGYRPIGIAAGHGNTLIKNNLIIDEADNIVAICLFSTFLNQELNKVTLDNNRFVGTGTPFSDACTGGTKDNKKAVVTFR